jgi:hypothetical protein
LALGTVENAGFVNVSGGKRHKKRKHWHTLAAVVKGFPIFCLLLRKKEPIFLE